MQGFLREGGGAWVAGRRGHRPDARAKIKPFSHAAGRVPGEAFTVLFAGESAVLYLFPRFGSVGVETSNRLRRYGDPKSVAPRNASTPFSVRGTERRLQATLCKTRPIPAGWMAKSRFVVPRKRDAVDVVPYKYAGIVIRIRTVFSRNEVGINRILNRTLCGREGMFFIFC